MLSPQSHFHRKRGIFAETFSKRNSKLVRVPGEIVAGVEARQLLLKVLYNIREG